MKIGPLSEFEQTKLAFQTILLIITVAKIILSRACNGKRATTYRIILKYYKIILLRKLVGFSFNGIDLNFC